jgi:hypothetical protein
MKQFNHAARSAETAETGETGNLQGDERHRLAALARDISGLAQAHRRLVELSPPIVKRALRNIVRQAKRSNTLPALSLPLQHAFPIRLALF